MNVSDNVLEEFEVNKEIVATFWQRFAALIIDGLVVSPLILVDWYNTTELKSFTILFVASLAGIAYKPLMEFKYGASLGKMVLHIKVVNKDFQPSSIVNALLRNIFDIAQTLVIFIFSFLVYRLPDFKNISTIEEFETLESQFLNPDLLTWIPLAILVVDIIFLLTDKSNRALHDRIAETFVVKR